MKRLRLCSSLALAALLIGLAFAPLVSAQEQRPSNFPRMQGSMQPPPPEQVAQVYAEKLGLSDNQKSQLIPILADRQQQIQALRHDTSTRPRMKMIQAKRILDKSDTKIEALLSQQQKEQYAQLKQQMREQIRSRMQNRGAQN